MLAKIVSAFLGGVCLLGHSAAHAFNNATLPVNVVGIEFVVKQNSARRFYIDAKPGEMFEVSAYKRETREPTEKIRFNPEIQQAGNTPEQLHFAVIHEGDIDHDEEAFVVKAMRIQDKKEFPAYEFDVFVSKNPDEVGYDMTEQRTADGVVLTNNGRKHIALRAITLDSKTSPCYPDGCKYIFPGESKTVAYPKGMSPDEAKEAKLRLIDISGRPINLQKGFWGLFN